MSASEQWTEHLRNIITSYNNYGKEYVRNGVLYYINRTNGRVCCKHAESNNIRGSVSVLNGTQSILNRAFASCYHLTGITIPESVSYIGDKAFAYCGSLRKVHIQSKELSFGKSVFLLCEKLPELDLRTVQKPFMGKYRFVFPNTLCQFCTNLKHVWLPDIPVTMSLSGLNYCENLKTIYVPHDIEKQNSLEAHTQQPEGLEIIYYTQ